MIAGSNHLQGYSRKNKIATDLGDCDEQQEHAKWLPAPIPSDNTSSNFQRIFAAVRNV
ncbi:MAG: hypothetical protein J0I79_15600 [Mesorhizobium sp.]|nr:hypothetical protein [Mesorhizobium sp. M7A.F.Ca.US.001.04.1.1]MBN9219374.1 hypothetical protein [Mesorhizobium sp.]